MVQQLIIDGNYLHLFLNFSPTGENAKTICKFSLTLLTKNLSKTSLESYNPYSFANGLTSLIISSMSSVAHKLGTSPVLRTLLISSKNDSLTT